MESQESKDFSIDCHEHPQCFSVLISVYVLISKARILEGTVINTVNVGLHINI